MEKSDFTYRRKPAFISFFLVYLFCFGISYWLINSSSEISRVITEQFLARLHIPRSNLLRSLPYGIIFSIPFLFYGIRKLLWNLMSSYEITPSEVRLLTGSLSRREHFFAVSDFYKISFRQSLIETPFGVGCIILHQRNKSRRLIIKGVFDVKSVVEALRPGIVTF